MAKAKGKPKSWWAKWREARQREQWIAKRRAAYGRHLQSDFWKALRLKALARAGDRCEWEIERGPRKGLRCGETTRLGVHHLHYQTFGRERLEDVQVLCPTHHKIADARRARRGRATNGRSK